MSWRWWIWLAYVTAWTAALVVPVPDTGDWTVEKLRLDLKYLFAKSLHVTAYALMTGLTGWLRAPLRYRPFLVLFLMAHGTATELLQLHVANRTGLLDDVAFDHVGVALGMLFYLALVVVAVTQLLSFETHAGLMAARKASSESAV